MSLGWFLVAAANAADGPPVVSEMHDRFATLTAARDAVIRGDLAKAKTEGWKMNIAILDAGGNLKHFSRMDDSFLKSIDIAMIKAQTSAGFPFSTKQIGEIAATRVPGIAHIPGIATFEGGLPILTGDGKHIGAIGVSGASAEQDGLCAQAALDAVKNDLK